MNTTQKDNLLFFGELSPKTIHGVSISNSINLDMLSEILNIYTIEEVYDFRLHNTFSLYKIFLFFIKLPQLLFYSLKRSYKYFYGVIYLSTFGIIKNILTVLIFKIFNPKGYVFLHFHRSDFDFFYKNKINRILFNILNNLVYNFIVLSDSQEKQINKYNITKISVLFNTIENEINLNDLNYLPNNENVLRITFIGNLIKEKGIIELIKAVKILNKKEKNFYKLDIYGNKTNNDINLEIDSLLFNESNMTLHSPIFNNNKFDKIYNSDLLILPSYNEGLPLTLLECLYLNKPIIITNVGYISEVLGDEYPLYCKPRSVDSIIKAVENYTNVYFKKPVDLDTKKHYFKFSRSQHKINILNIFNV